MENHQLLFELNIIDLYSAKKQFLRALPKLRTAASDMEVKSVIDHLINQTQDHVFRIRQIFEHGGFRPVGQRCLGLDGLIEQIWVLLNSCTPSSTTDESIMNIIQKCERYEANAFIAALAKADSIGDNFAATLLRQSLDSEELTRGLLVAPSSEVENGEACTSPCLKIAERDEFVKAAV